MIFSVAFPTCTIAIEAKKRNATAFLHRPVYEIEIEEISGHDAPVVLRAPSGQAQPGWDPVPLEIRKTGETFLQPVHVHAGLSYLDKHEDVQGYLGQVLTDYNLDAYGGKLEDYIFRHTLTRATVMKACGLDEARTIVTSSEAHALSVLGLAAARYRLVDGVLFEEIVEPKVILEFQSTEHEEYTARLEHLAVRPDGAVPEDRSDAIYTYSIPDFVDFLSQKFFAGELFGTKHRPLDGWELMDRAAFTFDGRAHYLADALRSMISTCEEGRRSAIIIPSQVSLENTSPEFCALYFEALDLVGTQKKPKRAQAEDILPLIEAMATSTDDEGQLFMRGNLYAAQAALDRFESETLPKESQSLAPGI